MRCQLSVNYQWSFSRDEQVGWCEPGFDDSEWESVDIPHANKVLPRHYFDDQSCCFVSCYRKRLDIPSEWEGLRVFLHFEAVSSSAKVFVDGRYAGMHEGGYTPFDIELTDIVKPGKSVSVAVVVDSSEQALIPPFGGAMDYLTYGGIYRQVSLVAVPPVYLSKLRVRTAGPLQPACELDVAAVLEGCADFGARLDWRKYRLELEVSDPSGSAVASTSASPMDDGSVRLSCRIDGAHLWSPEDPFLYHATLRLYAEEMESDRLSTRFGIRDIQFTTQGFCLNGKFRKLRGLNRHQCYPYIGYAAPDSLQVADAELLKQDLAVDVVRTSHYPQSSAFLDRCDELGLLVLTEIPGWQHIGSAAHWRDLCLQHVRELIERDWNHPSIISWGVRINESADDHELYTRTNELTRSLDPTRPTSGIRNFAGSELLEDIYTYNDFIHRGDNRALDDPRKITKSSDCPYLVTEHNGHMFPTKRIDSERHRTEHALRHARVLDAMYGDSRISGAIGWCMSDYNTHANFGSGDQVCYHGVCDMFRVPKLAAWVYASQSDAKPVMAVSSTMDIGDHPAGHLGTVAVFTNCDRVDLWLDDIFVGSHYPSRDRFPHLPHPPVLIDDFIGDRIEEEEQMSSKDRMRLKHILLKASEVGFDLPFGYKLKMLRLLMKYRMKLSDGVDLFSKYVGGWGGRRRVWRFEGIRDGEVVCVSTFGETSDPLLQVQVTKTELRLGDTYDMAAILLTAVLSGCDQPLSYANEALQVAASGAIALSSPALTVLEGGSCGIYVRTIGVPGPGRVDIHSMMGDISVGFVVS